ncbi:MAG: protein phosphatase CheZ [Rhodocyclales bacterium]|nr:protein phosphatase CheZ [Rhodocyclales bacterium]
MAKPIQLDDGSDSEDLQALFDSIAAGTPPAPPPPPARKDASGDSDDLQDLFDSVVEAQAASSPSMAGPVDAVADGSPQEEVVFNRLGHLARQLHDSLRGLGVDKMLAESANQIPDARQRLTYIAQMTEQAASRVLNAADIAKPIQDELIARSDAMSKRWDKMFANQLSVEEFKMLAADTRSYFAEAPARLKVTNEQLMEIMLAQDFQDLTGQVIKKVVEVVQGMETQLLSVLIEAMPEQRKAEAPEGLLNGPVITAEGRSDVVTSQAQVDDLLESLGF